MNIRITDPHDEERIRKFAKTKRMPITKAVGEAVRLADEVLFMQGVLTMRSAVHSTVEVK